jgi:hypothetical protein
MSSTTCEKLVKYTVKSIAKKYNIDYDELKSSVKKVVKIAKNFDESLLGMMEEIMDLGNVGSPEELEDFNIEVLKIYCKIKELDTDGSDRHIRSRVWKNIESEFELEEDSEEEDSDQEDSDQELEDEEEDDFQEEKIVEVPPETPKPSKEKKKKRVQII